MTSRSGEIARTDNQEKKMGVSYIIIKRKIMTTFLNE